MKGPVHPAPPPTLSHPLQTFQSLPHLLYLQWGQVKLHRLEVAVPTESHDGASVQAAPVPRGDGGRAEPVQEPPAAFRLRPSASIAVAAGQLCSVGRGLLQISSRSGILQCGLETVFPADEHGGRRAIFRHGFPPLARHAFVTSALCGSIASPGQSELSWYDSLIVSSAIQAQCEVLLTGGLQHDPRFGSLQVANPFL
jgi:hypothetical protein